MRGHQGKIILSEKNNYIKLPSHPLKELPRLVILASKPPVVQNNCPHKKPSYLKIKKIVAYVSNRKKEN